jgi:hypothetical protein
MSEQAQRILLWCAAVLLVAGTAIALRYAQSYRTIAGIPAIGQMLPPNVNLRLERLTIRGRKDNQPAWVLKADRLDSSRLRDRLDFSGNVNAVLIREGVTRATLTAATASYVDPPKVLTVAGNLKALLKGDPQSAVPEVRFETNQVVWNVGAKTVSCPDRVRLAYGDSFVQGEQLQIDLKTRNYSIKNMTGETTLDDTNDSLMSALPSLQGLTP